MHLFQSTLVDIVLHHLNTKHDNGTMTITKAMSTEQIEVVNGAPPTIIFRNHPQARTFAGWVLVGFEMIQVCIQLSIMRLRCNVVQRVAERLTKDCCKADKRLL